MYHLKTLFPQLGRWEPLPVSRDQAMLLMAATNEIFLGIDIYLAHMISGTIVPNEWIPIVFGPLAGITLLMAGLLALRNRPLATTLASGIFVASIAVGLLGAYFHLVRLALPAGPVGEQVTISLLVWGPPVLGPLMFSLVGLLGISAAWVEEPPDSGSLVLLQDRKLHLPYSKTRAYFFMVSLGALATVISSVLDHARANFTNPWLWLPTAAGVLAAAIAAYLGATDRPARPELWIYLGVMILMNLVGVIGFALHVDENLTAANMFVGERFIRGAPVLAPLLFANIGMLGIITLLDPRERTA